MLYHGAVHEFRTSRHLIFEIICESTKYLHFSNLNQPARLHINIYFFFDTNYPTVASLWDHFFLEEHVFQKNLFLGS